MWTDSATQQVNAHIDINTGFNTSQNVFDERLIYPVKASLPGNLLSNNFNGFRWTDDNQSVQDNNQKPLVGIADTIKKTRKVLGLPKRDIAYIFNISRPTLDKYLKETGLQNNVNEDRLNRVLNLERIINKAEGIFSRSPGAMAKNHMIEGQSLFNMLCKPTINEVEVLSICNTLAGKMASRPNTKPMVNETLFGLTKNVDT